MDTSLSHQLGLDGYIWWVGVIESLDDPLKIGRAKVRIIGWHTPDEKQLSTNDLPWGVPVVPVTQAGAVPNYRPGDWVIGFFLDGPLGQQPMITGVLPTIPQGTSMLGSLAKTAIKTYIKSQTGI